MSNNFQTFLSSNSLWNIYKKLYKSSKFADAFFQSICHWPTISEHLCNTIIFKIGYMLNEGNCQNMKERDVSVIKCIFNMLIEVINYNLKADILDECRLMIAVALNTLRHAVYLLEGSVCTQYGEECKNSQEQHYGVLYLCRNFVQCKLSTNCLETLVTHDIPTLNMPRNNWPKCSSPAPYQYDSYSVVKKSVLVSYEKVRQNNGYRFFKGDFIKEIKNNKKPFQFKANQSSWFTTTIVKEDKPTMSLSQRQSDEITGRIELSF